MKAASPTWGSFVTHYDSIGQAPTMVASFNDSKTVVSVLFDRMVLSLQGNDKDKLAGSIGLAGFFPISLPDEFPLRGFVLIARGIILKSSNCSAVLTISLGEGARVLEWPTTSKIVDATPRKSGPQADMQEFRFDAECFSGATHLAIGDPPKFPPIPPLTLAVGMHARRRSTEDSIEMHFDSLDIAMLSII
jgi:hypothetical protein